MEQCTDVNEKIYYHYCVVVLNVLDWHHFIVVYKLDDGTKYSVCGLEDIYLGREKLCLYTRKNDKYIDVKRIQYVKFTAYDADNKEIASATYSNTPADFRWLDKHERTNDMNGILKMFLTEVKYSDDFKFCSCDIKMIGCKALHLKRVTAVEVSDEDLILTYQSGTQRFRMDYIEEMKVMGMRSVYDEYGEEIVGSEVSHDIYYEMPLNMRKKVMTQDLTTYLAENNWFSKSGAMTLIWRDGRKNFMPEELGKFLNVEEVAESILSFLDRVKYDYPYFRFIEVDDGIEIDFGSYTQKYLVTNVSLSFKEFCRKFNKYCQSYESKQEVAVSGEK